MLVFQLRVAFFLLLFSLCATASDVQRVTAHAMAGKRGCAVVVNIRSGTVIASHNLQTAARRLVRPGSAVKPFTLLALLESGVVKPEESLSCRRKLEIAGHKLDCSHPDSGQITAVSALAYSCNDYFTTMAARLRPGDLQQEFLRAGLATSPQFVKTSVAGEIRLSDKREQLQLQAIGEQNIRTTPLSMLEAYRRLALLRINGHPDAAQNVVLMGLDAATDYGLARMAQPASAIKVAGKTGTAMADEGLWTHGWFVGFAPADHPEIALVVFLERGSGPADAASIAREIFAAYQYGSAH